MKSNWPPKKLCVKCGSPQAPQALKGAEQDLCFVDVLVVVTVVVTVVDDDLVDVVVAVDVVSVVAQEQLLVIERTLAIA